MDEDDTRQIMYTHQGRYLKPPIKLIGAKSKSRDRLYPLFADQWSYVEPFLGSGSILIGKDISNSEYANDINWYVINFYTQLRENPEQLWEQIELRLELLKKEEKEYFIRLRDNPPKSEVGLASWFYIINKSCMNGIFRFNSSGKNNSSYCGTTKGRGWIKRSWFELVRGRIKDVKFQSKDVIDFIDPFHKDSDTFIFLDPPYFLRGKDDPKGTVTVYNGKKYTTSNHEGLADFLLTTKAKWLMTINDCHWVREKYKTMNILDNPIHYSCSQTAAGRGVKNELIITNYNVKL